MPTYETPAAIDVAIDLQVGAIAIVAGDRADTIVTVTPTTPGKPADRRAAEQTRVDFDGERLTIVGPRPRISFIGPSESVDVRVELPTASRLTAAIAIGGVRTTGRLGATRIKSSMGDVDAEATGDLWVRVSHGSATVGTADGGVDVTADFGQTRVAAVTGDAIIKASHGSILVGESGGDLEAKLSYGDLEITKALGSVTAKTAYGSIRLGEVAGGSVDVESGYGTVAIGVRPGVSAWLDLSSKEGRVRSDLDGEAASGPGTSGQTVSVRARTQYGDITIHRA